jgi:hypothetical protein
MSKNHKKGGIVQETSPLYSGSNWNIVTLRVQSAWVNNYKPRDTLKTTLILVLQTFPFKGEKNG